MAIPLAALAAGGLVTAAVVNAYNGEKARGADRQRLKEIRDLFEKIKPPNYDVSIDAPPDYHQQVLQMPEFQPAMGAPQFDASKLTPEDLKVVGKYTPEIAPYIAEANPELVQRSAEAMQGQAAQKKALEKYMQMGETGDDAISAQEAFMARQQAGADTRARSQAIAQNFARRGQLGSGMQFAAELQGGQAAGNQQALAQMQAAADAQRRRLQALASGATLGGQIYGQEMDLASQNTNIINDFNRRMAGNRQAYENMRVGSLNDAQRFNLGMEQEIANINTRQRNDAQEFNLRRGDELTRYGAEWQRGERNRADDIAREKYRNQLGERDYKNDLAERIANFNRENKRYANTMRGQQFDDEMAYNAARSGVRGQERQGARERDIDRATQVQGLANAGASYFGGQQGRSDWATQQAAEDERYGIIGPNDRKKRRNEYYGGY